MAYPISSPSAPSSGPFKGPKHFLFIPTEDKDVLTLVDAFNKRKDRIPFTDCAITFSEEGLIKGLNPDMPLTQKTNEFAYQVLSVTRNILSFEYSKTVDPALMNRNINPYLARIDSKAVQLATDLAKKITKSSYYQDEMDKKKFIKNLDFYALDMALHYKLMEMTTTKRVDLLLNIRTRGEEHMRHPRNIGADLDRSLATGNITLQYCGENLYRGQRADDLVSKQIQLKALMQAFAQMGGFTLDDEAEKLLADRQLSIPTLVERLGNKYAQIRCLCHLTSQDIPTTMSADLQTIFSARQPFNFDPSYTPNTQITITLQPNHTIHIEFEVHFVRPEDPELKVLGKTAINFNLNTQEISLPKILEYQASHVLPEKQQRAQKVLDQAMNKTASVLDQYETPVFYPENDPEPESLKPPVSAAQKRSRSFTVGRSRGLNKSIAPDSLSILSTVSPRRKPANEERLAIFDL